jgi:hypothetical protein
MNKWTKLSIEYANQRSYLDDLFQVYPTIPEGIREINEKAWADVEKAFNRKNNDLLIRELLKLDLFPIKDSYIAYLKRDKTSIDRNPRTINRICGRIYELGLDKLYERCSEPKETNRQISPMFREWLRNKSLGITPVDLNKFLVNKQAKFLTDFGGHQNAQFNDAISTVEAKKVKAEKIAILDGILYIQGKNKMYKSVTETYKNYNIMSALVLRDFLYQL